MANEQNEVPVYNQPGISIASLVITSRTPLYKRNERMDMINQEFMDEMDRITDPQLRMDHAKHIADILDEIKIYEQGVVLSQVIATIDKGISKMRKSGKNFSVVIGELMKIREEFKNNMMACMDMDPVMKDICQEVTTVARNPMLRFEIHLQKKRHIV